MPSDAATPGDVASAEEPQRQNNESTSIESPREKAVAPTPTYKRVWERVGAARYSTDGNILQFKVLSYNVLAQALLESHSYLYESCRQEVLQWDVRATYLYNEITNLSPDILCLQEVQSSHLKSFYSKFEEIGYFGIFKKKTGDTLVDGCAIYFKESIFKLKEFIYVEFNQPGVEFLDRNQIGIIVKLSSVKHPDTVIVVANTHLLYNPRRLDIRLAQLKLFLAEIDRVAYDHREARYLPLILAGDLNSLPDSQIISLLDESMAILTVNWDFNMWKKLGITDNCQHLSVYLNRMEGRPTSFSELSIYNSEYSVSGGREEEAAAPDSNKLYSGLFAGMFGSKVISHPLGLVSVYDKVKRRRRKTLMPSTGRDGPLVVDYMYYNIGTGLRPVERLRFYTKQERQVFGHLPNEKVASDHYSLVAVFELKPKKAL